MNEPFWSTPQWWLAISVAVLVFLGHFAFGANTASLAMMFTMAACALLVVGAWTPAGARALGSWAAFRPAGVAFFAAFAFAGLALTPLALGGAHPVWGAAEGGVGSIDPEATRRELTKLAGLAVFFMLGVLIGGDRHRAKLFFDAFFVLAALYAAWAFLEYLGDPARVLGVERTIHRDRLAGSFLSANTAATVFGVIAILSAARLWRIFKEGPGGGVSPLSRLEHYLRRAFRAASAFSLAMGCLYLTDSRGGLVLTICALLGHGVWEASTMTRMRSALASRRKTVWAVLGVLVGAMALMVFSARGRFEALAADAQSRLSAVSAHFAIFLERPWGGVGLGGFQAANERAQTAENWRLLEPLGAAHNVGLQWLMEGGLVASGFMFAAVALALRVIVAGLARRGVQRGTLRAIVAVSLLIIAHGTFDFALQVPSVAALWAVLLGIGGALALETPETRGSRSDL